MTPCWSVLDFWKIQMGKSSSTNWIFSLFQTGFLLPVQPSKINFKIEFLRLKIQLSKLIFKTCFFKKTGGGDDCSNVAFSIKLNFQIKWNIIHTKTFFLFFRDPIIERKGRDEEFEELLEKYNVDEIEEKPKHFYSPFCNRWISISGVSFVLIMHLGKVDH